MNDIKFKMETIEHENGKAICLYMTTGDFGETDTYNCCFFIEDTVEKTIKCFEGALNAMFHGYNKMKGGKPVHTRLKFTLHRIEESA